MTSFWVTLGVAGVFAFAFLGASVSLLYAPRKSILKVPELENIYRRGVYPPLSVMTRLGRRLSAITYISGILCMVFVVLAVSFIEK